MARLIFTVAIFLMTFSHNLMAAEAQMKKPIPAVQDDTKACQKAHDECLRVKDSKDYDACAKACKAAEDECSPKIKSKSDLTHTRFGVARSYRQNCTKLSNQPQNKK